MYFSESLIRVFFTIQAHMCAYFSHMLYLFVPVYITCIFCVYMVCTDLFMLKCVLLQLLGLLKFLWLFVYSTCTCVFLNISLVFTWLIMTYPPIHIYMYTSMNLHVHILELTCTHASIYMYRCINLRVHVHKSTCT